MGEFYNELGDPIEIITQGDVDDCDLHPLSEDKHPVREEDNLLL